jgi:signal transduction histidine kinase
LQKIIDGHGGRIWFTSKENKGTTLTFTLPIKTGGEIEEIFRKI